jgi:hypothetical protein
VIIGIAPAAVGVFLVWINRVVCSRIIKKKKRLASSPSDTSSTCGDSSHFFEMQSRSSNHSSYPTSDQRGALFYNNNNLDASKQTITIQLPLNIIQENDKHGKHSHSRSRHHAHVMINNNSSINNDRERNMNSWREQSCPPLFVKGRRRKEIVAHILAQSQEDDDPLHDWGRKSHQFLSVKHDYHNDLSGRHSHPKLQVCRQNLELIKILGEGNFGQVWKGRILTETNDLNIGCQSHKSSLVAVKMNKINSSQEDQQELLKEIDLMIRLFSLPPPPSSNPAQSSTSGSSSTTVLTSHTNVVSLIGYCTETGESIVLYYYLPFLDDNDFH